MACLCSVKGMPITLSPAPSKCEHCILGKQTRTAVPKVQERERATWKLGLVYVDLQGQMDTWLANSNLYSLDIIDDFSSMSWTILIPSKDAVEPHFEAWVNAIEAESGKKISAIQINNGELLLKDFKAFLEHCGIALHTRAAYTSAHNGRVEHLHRTLMNRARAMRLAAGVPVNCWDSQLSIYPCTLPLSFPGYHPIRDVVWMQAQSLSSSADWLLGFCAHSEQA